MRTLLRRTGGDRGHRLSTLTSVPCYPTCWTLRSRGRHCAGPPTADSAVTADLSWWDLIDPRGVPTVVLKLPPTLPLPTVDDWDSLLHGAAVQRRRRRRAPVAYGS
jgi:hypothetical protein